MAGILGYFKSSFDAVAQTFAQIEEDLEGDQPTAERDVAITLSTSAAFARVDLWGVGRDWEVYNDGKIPEQVQKHAMDGIEKIRKDFQPDGKVRSRREVILKAWGAVEAYEKLAETLEPEETVRPDPATTIDPSKSKLNACKLLHDSIRRDLQILFHALSQQLVCCDETQFARLRLTGFINQLDAQSRSFFDLYLSSRHDWPPPRWLESRCTITRTLRSRQERGCHVIRSSELKGKNLNLLLEESQQPKAQKTEIIRALKKARRGQFSWIDAPCRRLRHLQQYLFGSYSIKAAPAERLKARGARRPSYPELGIPCV